MLTSSMASSASLTSSAISPSDMSLTSSKVCWTSSAGTCCCRSEEIDLLEWRGLGERWPLFGAFGGLFGVSDRLVVEVEEWLTNGDLVRDLNSL